MFVTCCYFIIVIIVSNHFIVSQALRILSLKVLKQDFDVSHSLTSTGVIFSSSCQKDYEVRMTANTVGDSPGHLLDFIQQHFSYILVVVEVRPRLSNASLIGAQQHCHSFSFFGIDCKGKAGHVVLCSALNDCLQHH